MISNVKWKFSIRITNNELMYRSNFFYIWPYSSSSQVLEQERHELRLLLEQVHSECETKIIESNEDKHLLIRQLDDQRREQRSHDERQTHIIQELTEMNFKLSKDLQLVSCFFPLHQSFPSLSNRVMQVNVDYKNSWRSCDNKRRRTVKRTSNKSKNWLN